MTQIAIEPIDAFRSTVCVPGSKSLTNRALLLAALASGESELLYPLEAEDPEHMKAALVSLGIAVTSEDDGRVLRVTGAGGKLPPASGPLHLGNAGTAFRFLTAACCLGTGEYLLDGIPRMRERPIGQLVDPLRQLGADITYTGQDGFPPLRVMGTGLRGQTLTMSPTLSSQYISALLQVGPYCEGGLTLAFDGPVTSKPYVQMTIALMRQFGAEVEADQAFSKVRVAPVPYRATQYEVEPDASSASYFLAAAAIVPGSSCTIEGLGRSSIQGDVGFADYLHQMGATLIFGPDFITVSSTKDTMLRGIDVDMNDVPDVAMTLAVVALFAKGQTCIRNVANLRVKETDRLHALQVELTKLGATVEIDGGDLIIDPPANNMIAPAAIDTYNDHRMAMSFALAGLRAPGVVINDPQCVQKTFPQYFDYLGQLQKV